MRRALTVAGLVLAACTGDRSQASPRADSTSAAAVDSSMLIIARGASVAISVDSAPQRADSILAAAGMTVEEYEQLMYRIASDSTLSRLFAGALAGRR